MNRKAGFSMLELIIVAALMVVLAGVGLVLSSGQRASASTRSAALALAEDLRAARKRALSEGVPVALVFPSQNGRVALSEGYYLLEGDSNPRIRRVVRATSDGTVGFFNGTWATSESVTRTMPPGGTTFNFDTWNAPQPADFMLVFLPSGRVVSNGLVRHAETFHVVVTAGGDTSAGSAPGSPGLASPAAVFALSRASSPNTVLISPSGAVQVLEGLPGGGVTLAQGRIASALASLPAVTPPATAQPILSDVKVEPAGSGGYEALASGERTISLRTEAQSPEGALLYCRWTCAEGGVFGSPEAQRMVWDPVAQVYVSNWSYRPVGLPDKTEFHLACEVVDEFGNTAVEATSGVATVDGSVGDPIDELIVKRTQNGKVGLWRVNSDQSQWKLVVDETSIPGFNDFDSILLSSDSQKMVFQARTASGKQLWVVNVDGSGLRMLVGGLGSGSPRCYAFAPDGTAVAAVTTANGVVVQPLNGATIDVKPGMTGASLAWSPDSQSLFALPNSGSGAFLWDRASQSQTPATTGSGMYLGQALWPTPDKILYVTLGGGILVRQLDVPTDTASTLVNLGNGLTDAINLSRDNSQICCSVTGPPGPVMQAGDRLLLQPVAGGTGTYINPTPIVGNGFYSKDGLRLYSVAWATPSSSVWEVQQCNLDGSSPSIILSNCELMGVR